MQPRLDTGLPTLNHPQLPSTAPNYPQQLLHCPPPLSTTLNRLLLCRSPTDFIGASGYASTDVNVVPASHEVSVSTVNYEFLSFGM